MSIDVKYQICKIGVISTDNVRRGSSVGGGLREEGLGRAGGSTPRYP